MASPPASEFIPLRIFCIVVGTFSASYCDDGAPSRAVIAMAKKVAKALDKRFCEGKKIPLEVGDKYKAVLSDAMPCGGSAFTAWAGAVEVSIAPSFSGKDFGGGWFSTDFKAILEKKEDGSFAIREMKASYTTFTSSGGTSEKKDELVDEVENMVKTVVNEELLKLMGKPLPAKTQQQSGGSDTTGLFNCTVPVDFAKLETPQSVEAYHYCAESFIFAKARKAKTSVAPPSSKSYIASAWDFLNLPDEKKTKREKCAASRTAVIVIGAPGSGREALEPEWKKLFDKDCGYVRINGDRIVTGDDGYELGRQVWQETIDRLSDNKTANSSQEAERCVKTELQFQLKMGAFLERLISTAMEELHSFVFESSQFVDTQSNIFPHAFRKLYKVHVFAVAAPISRALIATWFSSFERTSLDTSSKTQSSASSYRTPVPFETICSLHQAHTALARALTVLTDGIVASEKALPNFSLYEATGFIAKDIAGAFEMDLKLIYQTDAKGQPTTGKGSDYPHVRLEQIATTSAAMLEDQVLTAYGESGKQALKDFKQINLACGVCACHSAELSAKANQTEGLFAEAMQASYTGSGCTSPPDCDKVKDPCKHTIENGITKIKCPLECGACYPTAPLGRGQCPKKTNAKGWKDWAFDAAKNAAMRLATATGLGSWFSATTAPASVTENNIKIPAPVTDKTTAKPSGTGSGIAEKDCASSWNLLLKSDINSKDTAKVKFTKNLSTKQIDAAGYILLKPKGSVKAPAWKLENRYSFWAYFKCIDGTLVHDHCRFGAEGEAWTIKVPISKMFVPEYDTLSEGDGMTYICRLGTSIYKITSLVYPSEYYSNDVKKENEYECRRVEGSQWCGAVPQIEKNGCLERWQNLQLGKSLGRPFGGIQLVSKQSETYYHLTVQLTCDNKQQLLPASCSPKTFESLVIPAGQFAAYNRAYYGCPVAKAFDTSAELENAMTVVELKSKTWTWTNKLNGFKEYLPAGVDESCAADWKVLTDKAKRDFDSNGFVRIQDIIQEGDPDGRYSGWWKAADGIWAKFVCKGGKLRLERCRIGEGQQIPPGKSQKEGKYNFNCGATKTTTVANVVNMVSRNLA